MNVCTVVLRVKTPFQIVNENRELLLDLLSPSKKTLRQKYDSDRLLNETDLNSFRVRRCFDPMTFLCDINF